MFRGLRRLRPFVSTALVITFSLAGLGQDLVPIGSITGGSSVFVFRNAARQARRFVSTVKPTRSKTQRLESVKKIKRQYETIAKVMPKPNRSKAVDPSNLPKARTLPAAEGSKLFAGVGEYYLEKGDFERAIEVFMDAVALDENNPTAKTGLSEAYAAKGNDLLVKEQPTAAKVQFLEALKYDAKNSAAYFGLGEVYADLDQYGEAIAAYEKSLENNKDLTEIYVPLGILYYQAGDIKKADELLTKALAFSSESSETQYFVGLVRAAQNRTEEALAAFQKAKTLDPTLAEAFHNSGEGLMKLKRPAEAVADYTRATELKPNYFDARFGLGEAQFALGKYDEAIAAYKMALKLRNNDWEVFAGLGEAYRLTNKFEEAEANYRNAALFYAGVKDYDKVRLADFHSKVGLVIGQQCDINAQKNIMCGWATAIRALQKAADLTDDPIDHVNLGWAYFRAGHTDATAKNMAAAKPNLELALVSLQKAVAAGPPASDFALQNLAAAQIDLGDYKSAIETLNKLLVSKPDLNFAKYALGVAYNKSGDLANAEKFLREASDKEPNNVGYLMGLGDTLISRKNGKELKKVIEKLRPLDPASAQVLETRAKLLRIG